MLHSNFAVVLEEPLLQGAVHRGGRSSCKFPTFLSLLTGLGFAVLLSLVVIHGCNWQHHSVQEPIIMATHMTSASWIPWIRRQAASLSQGTHQRLDSRSTLARASAPSPASSEISKLSAADGEKKSLQSKSAGHFLDFASQTGSPYHSVTASTKLLRKHGFQELKEDQAWTLKPGGKYFVTKDGSDIMAFAVGKKFSADKSGLSIIGAHTDSPCLRLRPVSKISSAGMMQVGVQTYGGGLWHTWFDRPLGCAGKVVVKDPETGYLTEKLVRIAKPIMIIPNLAIHLTNAEERKAFAPNTETHLQPVLCSKIHDDAANANHAQSNDGIFARHHAVILEAISNELGCKPKDIVDMDICLMDAAPGSLIGIYDEFVSSPRIDNLLSTWAGVQGIADWATAQGLEKAQDVGIMVSFDHEEVGSTSATGADSSTLGVWLKRILAGLEVSEKTVPEVLTRSFLISADCAHAVHPNYAAKHQSEHRPDFGKGIVIKTNANQRYATTPLTASLLREVCKLGNVPVQDFIVRNDSPCGSTIGPIISAQLGIRTIDIGAPQWAMHSCREICAAVDCDHLLNMCKAFYEHFRKVDFTTKVV